MQKVMKYLTTIFTMSLLAPAFVLAAQDPFDSYVERMIQGAQEGNGTVIIENTSSVSTGGQTAAAGESVTDGDVSASSHVETTINANNDGGTVQVKVETSQNGKTETKEFTKPIEADEGVKVNVSAHSDSNGTKVEADVKTTSDESEDASSTTTEDTGNAWVEVTIETRVEKAFKAVPNFFKRIFHFFWRF